MRRSFTRFGQDRSGNVTILAALGFLMIIGFAALGVDVGSVFADRRKLQTMADLAAITAASNLAKANAGAAATLQRNNIAVSTLVGVETGIYTANSALGTNQRFSTTGGGSINAARVTLSSQTPLFFGKFVTGSNSYTINTNATATATSMASFAIGSRLVSLDGGLLNAVLGGMLGTTLSLSAMDYQSLLNSKIDALDFLKALATKTNITAGTYTDLLKTNASIASVLQAVLSTQKATNGATGTATAALTLLTQAANPLTSKLSIANLIDPGPYGLLQIGDTPRSGALVSVYDMVFAAAQIANGTNQIATNLNLSLPGIASVSLRVSIGERPVGTSWFTVGPVGVSVHTAQTRAFLNVQLIGAGAAPLINLPIYVEITPATAKLSSVSCGYPNINTSSLSLDVKPGLVDAWIGGVTAAQMSDFTNAPNPPAATLVNLGLVQVTGRAHATIANPTAKSVSLSYADIQAMTKKTVMTQSYTASLIGSLLGDLQLNVVLIGLGVPIPGLTGLVAGILAGATTSIDSLLVSVLGTLGVGIGQADVWATSIRCDGAVLVN